MEVDWQITPKTNKCRVVVDHPLATEVVEALEALTAAGAPAHAVISFNPWNSPPDRYYIVATWTE
jgi:hypothetical protein